MTTTTLILKLNDGTELIASVEEKDGIYLCSDARQIMKVPDQESQQMHMALTEFMPYSDGNIAIPTNMAILATPKDDFENYYKELCGLIITPSSKIIV